MKRIDVSPDLIYVGFLFFLDRGINVVWVSVEMEESLLFRSKSARSSSVIPCDVIVNSASLVRNLKLNVSYFAGVS